MLRKDNPKYKATAKAYRVKHKEERDARNKAWRVENQEYLKEYRAKWVERNKDYSKNWWNNHKDKRKRWHLNKRYNISLEEYNRLVAEQDGLCLICGSSPSRLHVDHCHDTGMVRGLLCNSCNTGMGMLRDNSELLIKAANYLTNAKKRVTINIVEVKQTTK